MIRSIYCARNVVLLLLVAVLGGCFELETPLDFSKSAGLMFSRVEMQRADGLAITVLTKQDGVHLITERDGKRTDTGPATVILLDRPDHDDLTNGTWVYAFQNSQNSDAGVFSLAIISSGTAFLVRNCLESMYTAARKFGAVIDRSKEGLPLSACLFPSKGKLVAFAKDLGPKILQQKAPDEIIKVVRVVK